MATLINNDIYVCRAYVTLGEQVGMIRWHTRIHTVVGTPTDQDLATNWDARIAASLKALLVIDASYRGVGVQRRRPLPATRELYGTAFQGAGTTATPPLPKQVSGLVTLRTAFAGRKFRGRIYPMFPSEAENDGVNGRPIAGYVTRLTTLAALVASSFAGGAGGNTYVGQPCLFNEVSGVTVDFTDVTARTYWASQRRRGDFGATNVSPI